MDNGAAVPREGPIMAQGKKRLGKKHRQASTRPKKGRSPRATPTTGAVDPRKRKILSTKRTAVDKASRVTKQSPERERRKAIRPGDVPKKPAAAARPKFVRPADGIVGRQTPRSSNMDGREEDWHDVELLASQMVTETESADARALPLIAVCGRPNVGKSTLFNRLTGSRRSIVGDEPGITRDRIYGEIEWAGRHARVVDTGGILPDDPELIPSEIFRQAGGALDEAESIVMVVDGRPPLAAPDYALARLLLRGGKPLLLAVNKIDTERMEEQTAEYRRLGIREVLPISAEHGVGIGDLLDHVFATLSFPEAKSSVEAPPEAEAEVEEGKSHHRTHGEFQQH